MANGLCVIAEASINSKTNSLNNLSMIPILKHYKKHFDYVHYIGPSDKILNMIPGFEKNIYYSTVIYDKSIKSRLKFILSYPFFKKRLKEILNNDKNIRMVQLRIPDIMPILSFPTIKKMGIPITTYIAGDYVTSFTSNYNFRGSKVYANLFDKIQRIVIKNSIPVATGQVLAKKYSTNQLKVYSYLSTTHNEIIKKEINDKPVNLLYVGSLTPRKRVDDAIYALSILVEKNKNYHLTIVGDGYLKNELIVLVQKLQLEDYVNFLGQINNRKELEKIYLEHDILILPSLSEGTPKVLPEAMAYGVIPIAVKSAGSNKYIIRDGYNGFLVKEKSPNEIAKKCLEIYFNDLLRKQMVENGYNYAESHTIEKEIEKMWAFVKSQIKY